MKFTSIFVLFSCTLSGFSSEKMVPESALTERFHWSPVIYAVEEAGVKINKTLYNLNNFQITGMQLWKGKLFFAQMSTIFSNEPRLLPLVYVNLNTTEKSPKLFPYPKDLVNRISQISALDVDICDRLWFVDADNDQLYIIDLNHNKVLRIVQFKPSDQLFIRSITVDVNKSTCDNAYAYLVNIGANRNEVVVYRHADNKYWPIRKPIFTNQINKVFNFTLDSIVLYQDSATIDLYGNGSRILFLQFSGSDYLIAVPTDVLKNSRNDTSSTKFTVFGLREQYLFDVIHYDERNSILFFGAGYKNVLVCWNVKRFPSEFSENSTETISMSEHFKWLIHDMQTDDQNNLIIVTRDLRENDIFVYQLYTINIKELIKDTICDSV